MDFLQKLTVKPGARVDLSKIDPDDTFGWKKEDAQKQTARNLERIAELQELLHAEQARNLLIVLQAMDTGGKDGAVKSLGGAMNPQGLRVVGFKKPTPEELQHDFLWRIEKEMPGMGREKKGEVVFFNRSHYEDVLVVRVHNLVPPDVWGKRYGLINAFEARHIAEGTHILKFFLHISKDEQLKRLKDRMDDPQKHWKVSDADFAERKFWDDYQRAFEDALSNCSTSDASFIIIPANRKWFRDLAISEFVVHYLEALKMEYPDNADVIARARKAYEQEKAAVAKKPASGKNPVLKP